MLPIDLMYSGARQWPDAIAAEDGETSLTYRELVERVEALASALQQLAPGAGRCIAVCAPNTLEHLVSMLAILAAGHVWVPLNPRNGKAETDAIIDATRPVLVIVDVLCLDRFTPTDVPLVVSRRDGTRSDPSVAGLIAEFRHRSPNSPEPSQEATQAIKFTSGSTGKPKGVLQSRRSWNACAAGILDAFRFAEDERFLAAAPITHGTSCFILPILSRGGRLILLERPKPQDILAAFARHDVTATYLTPTMIYMLMADAAVAFPKLRHLIYSGAPMRPQQIRAAQSVFGACLESCYGQAEAPQIISYMRAPDFAEEANLGAAGHPGLGRSAVCVAALGQNCGAEGSYMPFVFATPITFVFRISGAALSHHDTITQVFHNGQALPACPSANPNGCYTSIAYDKWAKVWTVQAQARSNGLWGW